MRIMRYIVEGRGAFPIDMLRFSASWPSSASDVIAITPRDDDDRRELRQVVLCSAINGAGEPFKARSVLDTSVVERFASFGWRVIEQRVIG